MTPELLAPAGSMDALRAAVSAGADAVYLGAASFGARASVGFGPEELREALHFAHLHGRRVYVTVNTLVKDDEWPALREQLRLLRDLRADAVLIQDAGVWRLCREEFPELTLHASTQMALSSPEGIRWARQYGIRRVVLPREAALEGIRAAAATGVEIEVFAHGALCVSVSGQCALSASLGERSGNRGRCAQPCRLPYTYRDQTQGWLSPADLCALGLLGQLRDAGAASLKLEGRLKRPEYVYIVTDAYRRALDRLERPSAAEDAASEAALRQVFSRGPFTRGYAGGCQDAGILSPVHTAHEGIPLGAVTAVTRRGAAVLAQVRLDRTLNDQDGLAVGEDKCIYTGPEVPAGRLATLRLHRTVPVGTPVTRTESAVQLQAAQARYTAEALHRLDRPVDMRLLAMPGGPARLILEAGGTSVAVNGPMVAPAASRPLGEAVVRQAMEKTGGAPFRLRGLEVQTENAYLSSAQLNALRREGLRLLEEAVAQRFEAERCEEDGAAWPEAAGDETPPSGRFLVRTERPEDVVPLLDAGADLVLLALRDVTAESLPRLSVPAERVMLLLPPVADDRTLERLADWVADRGLEVAADNIAHLAGGRAAMTAEGIPVFNARAERFLRSFGVRGAMLSPELSGDEIRRMPPPCLERIVMVYGRQRLMLLSHCPERVRLGLRADRQSCRRCDAGDGLAGHPLTDRMGVRLPMIPYRTDAGCVIRLYGGAPVSLLPYMDRLRGCPVSFLLSMTDEAPEERPRILRAFLSGAVTGVEGVPGKFLTGVA